MFSHNLSKGPFLLKQKTLAQPGLTASKPCPIDSDLCYAGLFHGGNRMSNANLLPSLLFKINQHQLAL
ncbi:hypothetical protein EKA83_07065 [Pseudomonas veronii]|nr:hypothetical protein EKA83_07065 [Pseudomonas veronii]